MALKFRIIGLKRSSFFDRADYNELMMWMTNIIYFILFFMHSQSDLTLVKLLKFVPMINVGWHQKFGGKLEKETGSINSLGDYGSCRNSDIAWNKFRTQRNLVNSLIRINSCTWWFQTNDRSKNCCRAQKRFHSTSDKQFNETPIRLTWVELCELSSVTGHYCVG